MNVSATPISNEPATLADALALLAVMREAMADFKNKIECLTGENQILRQKLDAFIRRYFGKKGETLDSHQLQLLLAGLNALEAEPVAPAPAAPAIKPPQTRAARKPARSGLPENLPIEETVIIPDEVKANPEQFREIEKVVTKELDYKPGCFIMRHYVRVKYVRKEVFQTLNNTSEALAASTASQPAANTLSAQSPVAAEPKEVLIAPLPNRLVEKGLPGVGLLIYLLLSRFEDHLPFFRLEKIFRERHGVPIARQSMIDWMEQLAFWFAPIYEEMKTQLLAGGYLQADETVIRYLDREVPGHSRQGYFWVYSRPGGDVIFDWQTSRGQQAPKAFLKDFKGDLQTDGYEVYQALIKVRALEREDKESGLLHFCCWAHARRKFFDAKDHDRRAPWFLRQIGSLYEIEKRLRLVKAGPRLREAVRGAESKMILDRIGKALHRVQPRVLAQSNLGRAISYTLNLWAELTRYADHGKIEIDNNLVENAIRPTAIGKKNFLFIGHPDAGGRSAMIYSILGSCRRRGIDPAKYLADVLKHLPDMKRSEIPSVTPGAWAKAHPEARLLPRK